MIDIDGSYGEGGGQVLRTSLTLSVLTGRAVKIENIRARRPKSGLAAQHLTAVRAAAAISGATVSGDQMGSRKLIFEPGGPPRAGAYSFDVAQVRGAGSAGAVSLVLQTIFLPLALAEGDSQVTLRGGTHVAWSPSVPYLTEVYVPACAKLGLHATLELTRWGFYPAGGGEIVAQIRGGATDIYPLSLMERGALARVWGVAVVSNLPAHIPQRMANRARNVLAQVGLKVDIQAQRVRSNGPGAGIFILTESENGSRAGFTAYGRKGLPAERVAEAACQDLIAHHRNRAPVDRHLADQLILPLTWASGPSRFATCRVTEHLRTNVWIVERFGQAQFEITGNMIAIAPKIQR